MSGPEIVSRETLNALVKLSVLGDPKAAAHLAQQIDRLTAQKPLKPDVDGWLTVECEQAFYVDRGATISLCDRLPRPVTLVLKLKLRSSP